MLSRTLTLSILAGLTTGIHSQTALAQPEPPKRPHFATEHTRREISPDKPMFMHLAGKRNGGHQIKIIRQFPDDVRPHLIAVGGDMDALNEEGIYFWMAGHHRSRQHKRPTREWKESLYQKYPYFLGFAYYEPDAAQFAFDSVLEDLELAAKYGGYIFFYARGKGDMLQALGDRNPAFIEALMRHSDRVIHLDRQTTTHSPLAGGSDVLGGWLMGMADHQGLDSQYFMWPEGGLHERFTGQEKGTRTMPSWSSVFTYPESLVAIEWLEAAARGVTVFSFENSYGIFHNSSGELMPGFKYAMLPLMRRLIDGGIIPSRKEVLDDMPVAYVKSGFRDPNRWGDNGFKHLYGPRYDDGKEWLPYSGRYGVRVPMLPSFAPPEALKRFRTVLTSESYPHGAKRVAWFNERFSAQGRGTAWFHKVKNHWFIFNPQINRDVNAYFEVPLVTEGVTSLSGVFTPHTFAIVEPGRDTVNLHVSNYRIDANADLWTPREDLGGKRFVDRSYETDDITRFGELRTENPDDDELRESILRLHGLSREPKITTIAGGEAEYPRPFEHRTEWDAATGVWTLRLLHNGPVDIDLEPQGPARPQPGNLAIMGTASASSHGSLLTLPDNAIDGNDRSSRWEAGGERSEVGGRKSEWLEVDLRSPQIFSRVVLKEHLDRITHYRLEAEREGEWLELAKGTTIGLEMIHDFPPVTAQKVRVRLLADSAPPSLYAFEIFGEHSPFTADYAAEAGDFHEAEIDAVLLDGAEIKEGAKAYQNGYIRIPADKGSGVRFMVKAPAAGTYRLGLRYARANWFNLGDGLLNLRINGGFVETIPLTQNSHWNYWRVHPVIAELKTGWNTVEYRNDYGDFGVCNLDHLNVNPVREAAPKTAAEPKAMPELPHWLTARRFDGAKAELSGARASATREIPGYSGEGAARIYPWWGGAGGLTFRVPAPRAGLYPVHIRYWNLHSQGNQQLPLHLNGRHFADIKFPRAEWRIHSMMLPFKAGENEIRLAGKGVFAIDSVMIPEQPDSEAVRVTGVDLQTQELKIMMNGTPVTLQGGVVPENASIQRVKITPSDPDIVEVSGSGVVQDFRIQGKAPGSATLTITSADGDHTATCAVTVLPISNIASEAKATANAQVGSWRVTNVKDGNPESKWLCWGTVGKNKQNPPWVRLEWKEPHQVFKIVISSPNSGEIVFSDGSTIDLSERGFGSKTGRKELTLDTPRTTSSVTYRLLEGGGQPSVSEIEVYERVK